MSRNREKPNSPQFVLAMGKKALERRLNSFKFYIDSLEKGGDSMDEEKDLVVAYLTQHIPETLREHLPKVFGRPEWDFDVQIDEVEIYSKRVFVNMRLRFSFPPSWELFDE